VRTRTTYNIQNPAQFKVQLLQWAQQFREAVYLDGNDYHRKYTSFDAVLAVDAFTAIETDYINAFAKLDEYQQVTKDWLFGYLSYDLKNDIEKLSSDNYDGLYFPDLFFFQPKKVFLIKGDVLEAHYLSMCDDEWEGDLKEILSIPRKAESQPITRNPQLIQQRISRDSYLEKVKDMLTHIQRGDIYEANFCMEFFAEEAVIDPLHTYQKLNAISNPPFAAYFKNNKQYLLCASPERYLRKQGNKIISQPIKGTARRSSNAVEDESIKQELLANEKERSENIMIVDLVRNDLSRTAAKGSVTVEELCGAYTFKQVHHLISTVSSQLKEGFTPTDALKTTFPMGSMTGAPKISAMEIIEKLEETKRGLYSGALGYFTPNGDFDFNVVIRSILYNASERYVSFSVGSAITAKAVPEKEYEECLLKAKAMRSVLEM
jgi:para-aminobenzoate synthetase component 1